MATTQAGIGYGTTVEIEDETLSSPPVYVVLEEIFGVTPPNQQTEQVEATHNTSPDRTREFITGLIDPGECSFEMNFIPGSATDQRLQELKTSGARRDCRVTYPNDVTWEFSAAVTGYEPSTPTDDRMTVTVTLRVSGPTTITIPSPLPSL